MSRWQHQSTFTLPAPPSRVFAALTEPAALTRWFAESVDVQAREGGAYGFWGKHTYGVPSRREATQRISRIDPPRLLAYTWSIHGQDGMVTLELEEAAVRDGAASTQLSVTHELGGALPITRAAELIDDLWRLQVGNLSAFLKDPRELCLPDFTDPRPEVRASILIDAPRERVFQALLDPATLNRWIASAASVEPRTGGRYSYGWKYDIGGREVQGGPTRVLEMVPNEKLVTDWPDWRGDASVKPTTVTWLLASEDRKTRVTVIHGVFPRASDASDYPFGWAGFLRALQRTLGE
ncbi:MAG TPA: SRPBCC family protein [Steroidobacteraceae bacterium]|nr:SRPBCC family protein [Steroidobacteraceae bacterium]